MITVASFSPDCGFGGHRYSAGLRTALWACLSRILSFHYGSTACQSDFGLVTKSDYCPNNRRMMTANDILSLGISERELRRHLSPLLSMIADTVGLKEAIDISLRFGGSILTIPKTVQPDGELARLIGFEAAEKLSGRLAEVVGINVVIPNTFNGPALRKFQAVRLYREGLSISQVAQALGISRSTAIEWRNRYSKGGP